jgi:hypothetical protein
MTYEVQTLFLNGQWENTWSAGQGLPLLFATREEASLAIEEHLHDYAVGVREGHLEDMPTRDEFRIVKMENEK